MKLYQIHRRVVWLGVIGLCFNLWMWADSQRYRTSGNWYFDHGVIVAIQHAGSISILQSNVRIPWEDAGGINGRMNREVSPVNLQIALPSTKLESGEGSWSQLIEIPHWSLIIAFMSAWAGILIIDHFRIRSIARTAPAGELPAAITSLWR